MADGVEKRRSERVSKWGSETEESGDRNGHRSGDQKRKKAEIGTGIATGIRKETGDMTGSYRDADAGIYLRLMTSADTDSIVAWRNSDAVRKNFIYQELFTREGHENWVRTQVETGHVVQTIICDAGTDKSLGSVYIRDIDRTHNKAEYGIFIGEPEARGRGVGTAAAKLMLRYCFEEEKLHRVYLRALAENMQAIRSYEKAGFQREGFLRDDVCIDGVFRDVVWMAAIAPDDAEQKGHEAERT